MLGVCITLLSDSDTRLVTRGNEDLNLDFEMDMSSCVESQSWSESDLYYKEQKTIKLFHAFTVILLRTPR